MLKQMHMLFAVALLCCAAFVSELAAADDSVAAPAPASTPSRSVEQIIVEGKPIAQLRLRIRIAEDAFYNRFNEINSDDRYDIHCFMRAITGSRIQHRYCEFQGWSEAAANYAAALLGQINGQAGGPPELFLAAQHQVEVAGDDELRRLSTTDPVLRERLLELGQAYQALAEVTGTRQEWTLEHELASDEQGLPFGAQRMVDVRIGLEPWAHSLEGRTFTFTSVSGKIRGLKAQCEHGGKRLTFANDVEWTLPENWGLCSLIVTAKRDTTFRFLEFE
jgi:hypothetical protein